MAVTSGTVPVDDSEAVPLIPALADGSGRAVAEIHNEGPDTLYVGGADVDETGYDVPSGARFSVQDLSYGDTVYGICDSGDSCNVRYIHRGA